MASLFVQHVTEKGQRNKEHGKQTDERTNTNYNYTVASAEKCLKWHIVP